MFEVIKCKTTGRFLQLHLIISKGWYLPICIIICRSGHARLLTRLHHTRIIKSTESLAIKPSMCLCSPPGLVCIPSCSALNADLILSCNLVCASLLACKIVSVLLFHQKDFYWLCDYLHLAQFSSYQCCVLKNNNTWSSHFWAKQSRYYLTVFANSLPHHALYKLPVHVAASHLPLTADLSYKPLLLVEENS